jgi:LytS/YehU family sensor histidine kinase
VLRCVYCLDLVDGRKVLVGIHIATTRAVVCMVAGMVVGMVVGVVVGVTVGVGTSCPRGRECVERNLLHSVCVCDVT